MLLCGSGVATAVLTRGLTWVGVALVLFVLLTRLRTLAIVTATRRGLGEASTVRIRTSRLTVEVVVVIVALGWWATGVAARGSFDWEVGGSGSPLHAKFGGIWFALGGGAIAIATVLVMMFTAKLAFARALDLREDFPRSVGRPPQALRLALMNPGVVFIAPRRSPLMWIWTEIRAAALGVAATLAVDAVTDELPVARGELGATIDEANEDFKLEERLAGHRGALTWNQLPAHLAAVTGTEPAHQNPLMLPPSDVPLDARSLGYWSAILSGVMRDRRRTKRVESRSRFDEQESIETILESTPGPIAEVFRERGVDALLYVVRGNVLGDVRGQLSYRHRRQLERAFREEDMDGAAAWMIEKVPGYPSMLRESVRAELAQMTGLIDTVMAELDEPQTP